MKLNWIPQLFMDLIGRILPGALIALASVAVIKGPEAVASLFTTEHSKALTFSAMLLWGVVSYLLGLTLGQACEETIGRCTRSKMRIIRSECKRERLEDLNRTLRLLGKDELDIDVAELPPIFVMHDHLRLVDPAQASRLLKLRSEQRLSYVMTLGFAVLALVNVYYLRVTPDAARWILEAALIIVAVLHWRTVPRRETLFANGVCILWFALVACGDMRSLLVQSPGNQVFYCKSG
jgi:hypothetical protein